MNTTSKKARRSQVAATEIDSSTSDLDPKTFFRRFGRHAHLLGDLDPKHVDLAELYAKLERARPALGRRSKTTDDDTVSHARGASWVVPKEVTRDLLSQTKVVVRDSQRINSCPPDPRIANPPSQLVPVTADLLGVARTTGEGVRRALRRDRDAVLDAIVYALGVYRAARAANTLPKSDEETRKWVLDKAFGCLSNRAKYHARRIRNLDLHAQPQSDDGPDTDAEFENRLPSADRSAEDVIGDREAVSQVARSLDDTQLRMLTMSVEGYKSQEIGAAIGKSTGAVRLLLFRTRKALHNDVLPRKPT